MGTHPRARVRLVAAAQAEVTHERRDGGARGGQLLRQRARVLQRRRARRAAPAAGQQHGREALQLRGRGGQRVAVRGLQQLAQRRQALLPQPQRGRRGGHRRQRLRRLLRRLRLVAQRQLRQRGAQAGQHGHGPGARRGGFNGRTLLFEQLLLRLLLALLFRLAVHLHARRCARGRRARSLGRLAFPGTPLLRHRRRRSRSGRVAQRLQRRLERHGVKEAEDWAAGRAQQLRVGCSRVQRRSLGRAHQQRAQAAAQRAGLNAAAGERGPQRRRLLGGEHGGDGGPVAGRGRTGAVVQPRD